MEQTNHVVHHPGAFNLSKVNFSFARLSLLFARLQLSPLIVDQPLALETPASVHFVSKEDAGHFSHIYVHIPLDNIPTLG